MNLYGPIAPSDRTSASVLLNEKVILDSFHFAKCRRLVANKNHMHSKLQRQNIIRNVMPKRKIYAHSSSFPTVKAINFILPERTSYCYIINDTVMKKIYINFSYSSFRNKIFCIIEMTKSQENRNNISRM